MQRAQGDFAADALAAALNDPMVMGPIMVIGGTAEMAVAAYAIAQTGGLAMAPALALFVYGFDQARAGVLTMKTGEIQSTLTNQALLKGCQEFGFEGKNAQLCANSAEAVVAGATAGASARTLAGRLETPEYDIAATSSGGADELLEMSPSSPQQHWLVWNANKGVDFAGSPDLYPIQPGQLNIVRIQYTGSRRQDFGAANQAANLGTTQKPPAGYTWHHLDDYDPLTNSGTMQLVKRTAHEATYPHNGGVRQYELATGTKYK